jgi:hypothetical protein
VELIPKVISLTDYLRLPTRLEPGAERHKEWHHFCILHPEVQVIANLSLMRRPGSAAPDWDARLVLLVKEMGWDGDVDIIPFRDARASRGSLDLQLGHNQVVFRDGCYHLSISLQKRPITLQLTLRPVAYPLIRRNTPISGGKINWVVIPRLEAYGSVVVGRNVYRLQAAPAYHDHNWGQWQWGDDFAWQWGFALPGQAGNPWCVVFDRMTDRSRRTALELKLSLWKGDRLLRLFMQDEIRLEQSGFISMPRLDKFPRPMSLLAPERTTDVPRRFAVQAQRGADGVECVFTAEHVAQIVVPNETDLGVTVINEVGGSLALSGEIKGERIAMQGRGFFEFLT